MGVREQSHGTIDRGRGRQRRWNYALMAGENDCSESHVYGNRDAAAPSPPPPPAFPRAALGAMALTAISVGLCPAAELLISRVGLFSLLSPAPVLDDDGLERGLIMENVSGVVSKIGNANLPNVHTMRLRLGVTLKSVTLGNVTMSTETREPADALRLSHSTMIGLPRAH
ncbi:hypothetical protein EVAR_59656_1 [Eumeta japonica]|uniref:Uncharacterized protein n=1 Tax=Eumeta variegata TaxID=151549 RepID=A0A4C1Z501_EUMVA|nr:hypothetical protein EVAR_59656_1 [Eumeta japonica]